jgi:hypothetical protein
MYVLLAFGVAAHVGARSCSINAMLKVRDQISDHAHTAARFQVLAGDFYGSGQPTPAFGGVVHVDHDWRFSDVTNLRGLVCV